MMQYLILYLAYLLGALIFVLDEIKKYQNIANANPDPKIVYHQSSFFKKEKINLIQMLIYGVVAVWIFPILFGGSIFTLNNSQGVQIWSIPMKTALAPILLVCGWTGGRIVIAFMGKSRSELYKKVGITETKDN